MVAIIAFDVAYSQLAVFASALAQPFNDWTNQHVLQGFAWRPKSVSFRSLVEAGRHSVEINVTDHVGFVSPEAVRAVEVPFEVPADGEIEIGSIFETVPLTLKTGSYLLRCEFLQPAGIDGERVRLTFAKEDTPRFSVIRADSELSNDAELLTTAQPASC